MMKYVIALLLVSAVFTAAEDPTATNCNAGDQAGRCYGCKTNSFVMEEDTAATTGKFSVPKCGIITADSNVAADAACLGAWFAIRNKGTTTINAGDVTQDMTAPKGSKVAMEGGTCFNLPKGKCNAVAGSATAAPAKTLGTTTTACAWSYFFYATSGVAFNVGQERCMECSAAATAKLANGAAAYKTCGTGAAGTGSLGDYNNKSGTATQLSPIGCTSANILVPFNTDVFFDTTGTDKNTCGSRTSATVSSCSGITNCAFCHKTSSTTTPKCGQCDATYFLSPNDYKCYKTFTAAASAAAGATTTGRSGIIAIFGLAVLAFFN